jgi:hypothetical protein
MKSWRFVVEHFRSVVDLNFAVILKSCLAVLIKFNCSLKCVRFFVELLIRLRFNLFGRLISNDFGNESIKLSKDLINYVF